jgi:hypothetical protein
LTAETDELQARPEGVRAYSHRRTPGFADCAPTGRVRLDAIARWLQDVAYADVLDAGSRRRRYGSCAAAGFTSTASRGSASASS